MGKTKNNKNSFKERDDYNGTEEDFNLEFDGYKTIENDKKLFSTKKSAKINLNKKQSFRQKYEKNDKDLERINMYRTKLFDTFSYRIKYGYNPENWEIVTKLYKQISSFLSLEDAQILGELWRNTYVADFSPNKVDEIINFLKTKNMPNFSINSMLS